MRAFMIHQFGERGAVEERAVPEPGPDDIRVAINVAGLNPADWKHRDGWHGERAFPLTLGTDFAGVVESVGRNVRDFTPGLRVFGIARTHGAFAETTVIATTSSREPIARIPAGLSDRAAAALPIPGLTALAALAWLEIHPGEKLVIVGASGAVGSYARQIAALRGINIIAYGRGDSVAEMLLRYANGVAAVLDLAQGEAEIKRLAPLVRPGGRIASTIFAADEAWFAQRDIIAGNIAMQTMPQSSRAGLEELAALACSGALAVRSTHAYSLSEAGTALDALKRGTLHGKAVVVIRPDSVASS